MLLTYNEITKLENLPDIVLKNIYLKFNPINEYEFMDIHFSTMVLKDIHLTESDFKEFIREKVKDKNIKNIKKLF